MKIKLLLFLLPFLAATLCTDEEAVLPPDPESQYQLQNDTALDLFLLTDNGFLDIPAQRTTGIGSEYNSTDGTPVSPSQTQIIDQISLYTLENGDYILVYEQDPIDDSLWNFIRVVDVEYELYRYTLIITDDELVQ